MYPLARPLLRHTPTATPPPPLPRGFRHDTRTTIPGVAQPLTPFVRVAVLSVQVVRVARVRVLVPPVGTPGTRPMGWGEGRGEARGAPGHREWLSRGHRRRCSPITSCSSQRGTSRSECVCGLCVFVRVGCVCVCACGLCVLVRVCAGRLCVCLCV